MYKDLVHFNLFYVIGILFNDITANFFAVVLRTFNIHKLCVATGASIEKTGAL